MEHKITYLQKTKFNSYFRNVWDSLLYCIEKFNYKEEKKKINERKSIKVKWQSLV